MTVSETGTPPNAAAAATVAGLDAGTGWNTVLVAIAFAGALLLPRLLWPWWINEIAAIATGVGVPIATGVVVYLFKNQLNEFARKNVGSESTRAIAFAVLYVDALLLAAFLLQPQRRIVRIVPGPTLLHEFGLAGRTLTVALDGDVFSLSPPPRQAVYAGRGRRRVLHAFSQETPEARNAVLTDVAKKIYRIDPANPDEKEEADGLVKQWGAGAEVMTAKGSGVSGFRVLFRKPDRSFPVALKLTPVQSSSKEGIETYAAELP